MATSAKSSPVRSALELFDLERFRGSKPPRHQRVGTPWWKRVTALISLGSLVVITGIVLAAMLGAGALLVLMFLERAAG